MSSLTPNYNFYLPGMGDGVLNGKPWGVNINQNFSTIDTTLHTLSVAVASGGVPSYTTSNNGQYLGVVGGALTWSTVQALPTYSTANNGQYLGVVGGVPTWSNVQALPSYSESNNGQVLGIVGGTPTWTSSGGSSTTYGVDSIHVYLNTAANSAANAYGKVPFDTVSYDAGGLWDSTNKRVVPKRPGYYMVNVRARTASSGGLVAAVAKNGTWQNAVGSDAGSVYASGGSDIVYCNGTTDYIECIAWSSAARAFTTGAIDTWMSVYGPIDRVSSMALAYGADAPPATPNAWDDEFNTDTGPSGTAAWSWLNQGAATYSIANGSALINAPAVGVVDNMRCLLKAISGSSFSITSKVAIQGIALNSYNRAGIFVRNSSTGRILNLYIYFSGSLTVTFSSYTSPTAANATIASSSVGRQDVYLRLSSDGTTVGAFYSLDGLNYTQIGSQALSTWIASVDGAGIYADPSNASVPTTGIFGWIRKDWTPTAQQSATLTDDYSTSETLTKKTWLGKPVYRKVINFGALPNNTTKNVAHGISGATWFMPPLGEAYNSGTGAYLPVVQGGSAPSGGAAIYINGTNVSIATVGDLTAYSSCYVTLEYTKT